MTNLMKLLVLALTALILSSCNVNPRALLGDVNSGGYVPSTSTWPTSSPSSCNVHEIVRDTKSEFTCDVPGEGSDLFQSVTTIGYKERVQLTLKRLPDGGMPELYDVSYRKKHLFSYATTKIDLKPSPGDANIYEFWVSVKDAADSTYVFESLSIKNSKCMSSAVYRHKTCPDTHFDRDTDYVTLEGVTLPELKFFK